MKRDIPRVVHRSAVVACMATGSALLGACASTPPADRIVYEVREVYVPAERGDRIPPAQSGAVRDDPASEAARRAWLEENYGARRAAARADSVREDRYVPQQEVVRERVVVVEREPRYSRYSWIAPVHLGIGYWAGRRHHGHGRWGWGWGLGWGSTHWW